MQVSDEDLIEQDMHKKFMRLALLQAKDALSRGEFPVGCVIVAEGEVVATGSRVNSSVEFSELDHAEIIALRNLQILRPEIDLAGITIYSTMEPCLMCYATLLVNRVNKVVFAYEDVMGGGTNLSLADLSPLYSSMKVEVTKNVLRSESLQLFQNFFKEEGNDYLRGTLLANYTLQQ